MYSYKLMYLFLTDDGILGNENYNSTDASFFKQNEDKLLKINNVNIDFKDNKTSILIEDNNIPEPLSKIYKIIGNPSREYYINNWNILSLNNVIKIYNEKKLKNQKNIIDFSILNMGMGHCIVCALDPRDKKIFFRHDGGSNGWEREHNYNCIIKYDPNSKKKYNFIEWMKLTKIKDKSPFDVNEEYCINYDL